MKPNILFILTDQFRADAIGCVGGWVRTPNLDALAARGCLFTSAFANSAVCIPSRVSLATGLYPHQTGVDRNRRGTLNPETPNWMKTVAAAGYQTSLFGKTHFHPFEGDLRDSLPLMNRYGLQIVDETAGPYGSTTVASNMTDLWKSLGHWDAYREDVRRRVATKPYEARPGPLPLELYYDRYVGDVAHRHLAALPPGPWFCWVSFGGPHEPWDAPEPYASMYDPDEMPPPIPRIKPPDDVGGLLKRAYGSKSFSPALTDRDIAEMRANYAGNVTLIDDEIGRLIGLLRVRGDLDRTLIVFTSDHGEMNGDHGLICKGTFLDPAVKVPLIIVPPGDDRSCPRGQRSDTLVELMDVGASIQDFAGASLNAGSQARSLRGVVEGRQNQHRSVAVSELARHICVIDKRYKAEFNERGEPSLLFDRRTDPQEQRNLLHDPHCAKKLAGLWSSFEALRGASPPVPGVFCEDPT